MKKDKEVKYVECRYCESNNIQPYPDKLACSDCGRVMPYPIGDARRYGFDGTCMTAPEGERHSGFDEHSIRLNGEYTKEAIK